MGAARLTCGRSPGQPAKAQLTAKREDLTITAPLALTWPCQEPATADPAPPHVRARGQLQRQVPAAMPLTAALRAPSRRPVQCAQQTAGVPVRLHRIVITARARPAAGISRTSCGTTTPVRPTATPTDRQPPLRPRRVCGILLDAHVAPICSATELRRPRLCWTQSWAICAQESPVSTSAEPRTAAVASRLLSGHRSDRAPCWTCWAHPIAFEDLERRARNSGCG